MKTRLNKSQVALDEPNVKSDSPQTTLTRNQNLSENNLLFDSCFEDKATDAKELNKSCSCVHEQLRVTHCGSLDNQADASKMNYSTDSIDFSNSTDWPKDTKNLDKINSEFELLNDASKTLFGEENVDAELNDMFDDMEASFSFRPNEFKSHKQEANTLAIGRAKLSKLNRSISSSILSINRFKRKKTSRQSISKDQTFLLDSNAANNGEATRKMCTSKNLFKQIELLNQQTGNFNFIYSEFSQGLLTSHLN